MLETQARINVPLGTLDRLRWQKAASTSLFLISGTLEQVRGTRFRLIRPLAMNHSLSLCTEKFINVEIFYQRHGFEPPTYDFPTLGGNGIYISDRYF